MKPSSLSCAIYMYTSTGLYCLLSPGVYTPRSMNWSIGAQGYCGRRARPCGERVRPGGVQGGAATPRVPAPRPGRPSTCLRLPPLRAPCFRASATPTQPLEPIGAYLTSQPTVRQDQYDQVAGHALWHLIVDPVCLHTSVRGSLQQR